MTAIGSVDVLVPARNEQAGIVRLLASVAVAIRQLPPDIHVHVVVACDSCTDDTLARAADSAAQVIAGRFGSPAAARAAAAELADGLLAERRPEERWIATTDADCVVPADWLSCQLDWADAGHDAVAGAIEIEDWDENPMARDGYQRLLASRQRPDGTHTGVYGANLGIRGSALAAVGGVPQIAVGEDRALWDAVVGHNLPRVSPSSPAVLTSARPVGRAVGGLADLLTRMAGQSARSSLVASASRT
jgi:glycosyltransferase involved in cell wall biosynthesis